jgi:uncharacterized membrane protein YfcA
VSVPGLILLGAATAGFGALGGIGGAVLLVPLLVLLGLDPAEAAPLGLLSVAAGSLAASARQLEEGLVHHRLGITLEVATAVGVLSGALLSEALDAEILTRVLAVVAILAAVAGGRRKGMRNLPHEAFTEEPAGEWPGTLAGAYRSDIGMVPYAARRIPLGMVAMVGAGLVSGLAGVGGGFIKTPTMSEVMHVPVKVAAATSTFTTGLTAATGLVVFAAQGRIDVVDGAAIVLGGLIGGTAGVAVQARLPPERIRAVLCVLLLAIGAVLLVTG